MTKPTKRASKRAKLAGATTLAAILVGSLTLVVLYSGITIETVAAFEIGTFLGLGSLAVELALIERDDQRQGGEPGQAVFLSFFLRLAVVGPLTLAFGNMDLGVHAEAFALCYFSTFFVYLCWLTWKTAHAPSSYQVNKARKLAAQAQQQVPGRKV